MSGTDRSAMNKCGQWSRDCWQTGQDFSILQGVDRKSTGDSFSVQALHVQSHMLIPAGQQLLKPCLSLGVWPRASYLTFLSLDFLIAEMAMSMQRTWCLRLPELRAAWATVGTKPGE